MPETRYFELNEDVGIAADGSLEPLETVGLAINIPTAVPTLTGGTDVVDLPQRHDIHPLPGTRIFRTDDPLIAAAVLDTGLVHETTQPTKPEVRAARDQTQDARRNAGTHTEPGENDTTDGKPTEA